MNYGEILANGNNHKLCFYKEYGSYTGDWIAVTKKDSKWFIWRGYYGSCSGCDDLQDFESEKDYKELTLSDCKEFSEDYKPFIEIEDYDFKEALKNGSLKTLMPANTRLDFSDDDCKDIKDSDVWNEISESLSSGNRHTEEG